MHFKREIAASAAATCGLALLLLAAPLASAEEQLEPHSTTSSVAVGATETPVSTVDEGPSPESTEEPSPESTEEPSPEPTTEPEPTETPRPVPVPEMPVGGGIVQEAPAPATEVVTTEVDSELPSEEVSEPTKLAVTGSDDVELTGAVVGVVGSALLAAGGAFVAVRRKIQA